MVIVLMLILSVAIILIFSESAYAYIDPGTGSMIVQAILAAIAAVSVSVGVFWRRLKTFFGRHLRREIKKDGGSSL